MAEFQTSHGRATHCPCPWLHLHGRAEGLSRSCQLVHSHVLTCTAVPSLAHLCQNVARPCKLSSTTVPLSSLTRACVVWANSNNLSYSRTRGRFVYGHIPVHQYKLMCLKLQWRLSCLHNMRKWLGKKRDSSQLKIFSDQSRDSFDSIRNEGLDMPWILLKVRGAFGNADTGGALLSLAQSSLPMDKENCFKTKNNKN